MIRRAKKKNPLYLEEPWNHGTGQDGTPDSDYIWDAGFHWGEWSEPGFVLRYFPPGFIEGKIKAGEPAVATAYLRYSTNLLSVLAGILGKTKDQKFYREYSDHVAELYEKYLQRVKEQLLKRIVQAKYHLNTGFLSTPFLLNVLADCGYTEAAYKVLEQTGNPSWLYPVTKGATTIYESWDGANLFFGSFNHYSYGAVCDFLMSYVNGIRIDREHPGYRHFFLKPVPGGSLTCSEARFESPYGPICSSWRKDGDVTLFSFEIPANTTADITLPDGSTYAVGSGKYSYTV